LRKILNNIAQNGEVPEDVTWSEVIRLLEFMIIEECQTFKDKSGYRAPEDEHCYDSFEQNLEVIITLLGGFREKPPFTLQRICELIVSGKDIYSHTHHFMFALEKCLNISLGVS
jgi:serine/threonine-protein phosphatase 4 regulatory subunit 2